MSYENRDRWARPLTEGEMAAIKRKINEAASYRDSWVDAIVAVFDIALHDQGSSWEDGGRDVRPMDYAIPEDQWQAIAQLLLTRQDADQPLTDIGRVNILLDWMNKGPSSYKVEAHS